MQLCRGLTFTLTLKSLIVARFEGPGGVSKYGTSLVLHLFNVFWRRLTTQHTSRAHESDLFCREMFSSAAAQYEFEREVCQLRRYYSCFMSKSYGGKIVLEVRQMEISFHNKIFDLNHVNHQI